jgi:transcriptional regulator with XRE-family HTH domain
MKEEREAFSRRLADAMRDAGYEPRPSVLAREFNLKYRGEPVSFQSASRWLRGRSIPEQDKLRVLAKWLGVELHALLFGAIPSKVAEQRAEWQSGIKPQERELVDAYRALSTPHRKLVRELIASLQQR